MNRVVIASGNAGKLRELTALLAPLGFELIRQSDLGVSEAVEDGPDFVSNALIKARHAARTTGMAALADDSGLEVDALDGAPGVRSARYAGDAADDAANNDNARLREVDRPEPSAAHASVCAVVLIDADGSEHGFEARCEGRLLRVRRGEGGFGYDPAFVPDDTGPDDERTYSELSQAEKNAISHRGRAAALLASYLANR